MKYKRTIHNWVEYENAMPHKIILTRECQGAKMPDFWWDMRIKVMYYGKNNKPYYKIYEGLPNEEDVFQLLLNYKEYQNYKRYMLPLEKIENRGIFLKIIRFIGWLDKKLSIKLF